jgi:hypothetical protein
LESSRLAGRTLGVEVSGFDSGLFDKIDEPQEDHPA